MYTCDAWPAGDWQSTSAATYAAETNTRVVCVVCGSHGTISTSEQSFLSTLKISPINSWCRQAEKPIDGKILDCGRLVGFSCRKQWASRMRGCRGGERSKVSAQSFRR
jgi:hypothetical protein